MGLAAVCSYGMPEFYNRAIHWSSGSRCGHGCSVAPGCRGAGCGLRRRALEPAARGAGRAGHRHRSESDDDRGGASDAQPHAGVARALHVSSAGPVRSRGRRSVRPGAGGDRAAAHPGSESACVRPSPRWRAHLAPGGRMVLLEAAPDARCAADATRRVFKARAARRSIWICSATAAWRARGDGSRPGAVPHRGSCRISASCPAGRRRRCWRSRPDCRCRSMRCSAGARRAAPGTRCSCSSQRQADGGDAADHGR